MTILENVRLYLITGPNLLIPCYPWLSLTLSSFPNFFCFSPIISDYLWLSDYLWPSLNISDNLWIYLTTLESICSSIAISGYSCPFWLSFAISGSLWQSYYLLLFLTIPSYFWSFLTISVHLCKLFQNFKLFGEWLNEWINFARYRGAFAPKNISRQFLVNLNFFNFFTITRMSAFPGCPNIFWENGNISFTELTYSDLKQVIIFRASLPCSRSILASSSN